MIPLYIYVFETSDQCVRILILIFVDDENKVSQESDQDTKSRTLATLRKNFGSVTQTGEIAVGHLHLKVKKIWRQKTFSRKLQKCIGEDKSHYPENASVLKRVNMPMWFICLFLGPLSQDADMIWKRNKIITDRPPVHDAGSECLSIWNENGTLPVVVWTPHAVREQGCNNMVSSFINKVILLLNRKSIVQPYLCSHIYTVFGHNYASKLSLCW